jgi:2-oxoglutarate dehydrogenase E1 component
MKFHKPVVVDMFCYRRFGHNEGDEPAFTQPVMYQKIAAHPSTLDIYSKRLIADGVVTEGEVDKAKADWRARLDAELEAGGGYKPNKADWLDGKWTGFKSSEAGVVQFATCQLSSAQSCKKRSSRAEECSGPWPS